MFRSSKVQFCSVHKSQICLGFCVSNKCTSNSIYCQKCLEENHTDHLDSCKEFEQIKTDLFNSIREKQDHLKKLKEKYLQLNELSQYQINSYEKQIDDIRNMQKKFVTKQYNTVSIQQINILKNQISLETQIEDLNQLNQIEQQIKSLELLKKDFLANQKKKFSSMIIKCLSKGSSYAMMFANILLFLMYIYIFMIGVCILFLIHMDYYDDTKERDRYFSISQSQYFNQANALYQMQNYKEAIDYYNKVINIPKDHAFAYFNKGIALQKLSNFKDALINYNKALNITSQIDEIYIYKGYALNQLKRLEEAIECYDRAIEINVNNDEAYYNKGRALDQLGRHFEAVESYDKAINIKSNNQHYFNSRGLALHNLKQFEQAIKSYDLALLNSINHEILENKANALLNLEKLDKAQEFHE
ncbi:unnamed protein product [Paramecium pentaurelia]|uniref:Tetratricopeptide repeat protein n=1 Tax=Paramecium pentaurelia TaxID=43138 RepID=A0A8S1VU71_9CILI|nr:unnamed protein product [Paramecium pentaurelia]